MLKNLLILFLFTISLLAFTQALDMKINNVTYTPISLIKNTDINFNIEVLSDNGGNAKMIVKVGNDVISDNNFMIDANTTKNVYAIWKDVNKTINSGDYNVEFSLVDVNFADSNSLNNTSTKNIQVGTGVDFVILSLNLSNTNPSAGTTLILTTYFTNLGDVTSGDMNVCYYGDWNNLYCSRQTSTAVSEVKTFVYSFVIPNDWNGTKTIRVKLDDGNEVSEVSEVNNWKETQISTLQGIDLYVPSGEITYSEQPKLNTVTQFIGKIKNIGGTLAPNVEVKVYHTSYSEINLIFTQQYAAISPGGEQEIRFIYTPYTTGGDRIYIIADPNNSTIENDENNNLGIKEFAVGELDINALRAYTLFFDIYKDCISLISNGDRLIVNGLVDENGTYYLDFKLTDSFGSLITSGKQIAGYEINLPNRTLRVMDVSKFVARMLIIYATPQSIEYTNCIGDVKQLQEDKEYYIQQLENCQISNREKSAIITGNEEVKTSLQTDLDIWRNNFSTCNGEKSTLSTNLALADNMCMQKLQEKETADMNFCALKDAEIDKEKQGKILGWGLFFASVICIAGVLAYKYKIRKELF